MIKGLSEKDKFNDKLPARSPFAHKISNLASHLTDHAFNTILGADVSIEHKNYLELSKADITKFNLPEKYVVITTGFTSKTREWLPESVNGVSEYCVSKGYTPVYLGRSFTKADAAGGIKGTFVANYDNGINLIDKTNLFEAASIMENAKTTLGLDNGLIHLAACRPKSHVIAGFTTVKPEHRLPYRNNIKGYNFEVIYPTEQELSCIGCQSKMNFASHDFRECFYKDYHCLKLLTSDKWIAKLERVLI